VGALLAGSEASAEELPLPKLDTLFCQTDNVFGLQSNQQLNIYQKCPVDIPEPKPQNISEDLFEEARKSDNGEILAQERHKLGTNCVSYVKEKYPDLPQGLWTLKDKERLLINTHEPKVGLVAITDEGGSGHVSIVLEVLDGSLVIEEGNFVHGYKTIRKIDKNLPLGYYDSALTND